MKTSTMETNLFCITLARAALFQWVDGAELRVGDADTAEAGERGRAVLIRQDLQQRNSSPVR